MRISQNGIDLIKRLEGFSARPYADVAGFSTIGYGHYIKPGETFDEISRADAENLLREDIAVAEDAIRCLVKVLLTQNQFDALASFIFNIGVRAFEYSTFRRFLNQGRYEAAAMQFSRWVFAGGNRIPGLEARRAEEKTLFIQPVI